MTLYRPHDLNDALGFLAEGSALVLAGATDVLPALGDRPAPERILDITALSELLGIKEGPEGWRIGAAVTWAELCAAALPPQFDALKEAGRQVGSVQIQTKATIAGNICNASPAADGTPVLMALGASVEMVSAQGRRVLPLTQFVTGARRTALGPSAIVTAIIVPRIGGDVRSAFAKLGSRAYLVISIASLAAVLRFDGPVVAEARIAVGACSPVPVRLPTLERELVGQRVGALSQVLRAEHFTDLAPIDDVRATSSYRRDACHTLAGRMLDRCGAGR
ncbi:MAG: FAD binding domain-containing protein [Paracoccaceae bacterium]